MLRTVGFWLLVTVLSIAGSVQAASLQDLEGKAHTLDEYTGNGQWTVVMFWASDCHVCNMEAEQYIQFHEAHKDDNARVVGISLDGQSRLEQAKDFMKRHNVTFPSLIGEPEAVAQMFTEMTGSPWLGTPTFLVFSPQGKLLAAQAGAVPTHLIEEFIQSHSEPSGESDGQAQSPANAS